MEVMEEGNLMDRVPILLQRDRQYYQEHQSVLQEPICSGVVGGKLDFPRYASFAAIKMVFWWEDEYFAAYRKHSGLLHVSVTGNGVDDEQDLSKVIVKNSDPDKFVSIVTKSAELLLEHLHCLSQESLDHADLTVLTATIGAAALIKNCLNIYLQSATIKVCPPKVDDKGGSLKLTYKQYSQMAEALAERLLDLHCRLLLLYIVQDADCLFWEDNQQFFESERGSYTVQMWWHYMKGTKDDLWNSVPPKMAQRIFAGMLNESLSVLTIRYSHIITSNARAQVHLVDVCNLLHCAAELLSYVSECGEAYIGLQITNQSIIIRDIHSKCRELFYCLLLRGAPLGVLSKTFRKGLQNMDLFTSRQGLPSAWIIFTLPRLFPHDQSSQWITQCSDLSTNTVIALELRVLLSAPEPDWSFLVKVLLMRDATLTSIILHQLLKYLPLCENFKNVLKHPFVGCKSARKCNAFLCREECFNVIESLATDNDPIGQSNCQIVLAITYIVVAIGKASDVNASLIAALDKSTYPNWSDSLDKKQVWNQKRPPWLEAIVHFVYPIMDCIVEMLINAVETGASMYQAMSLAITCISEMWDCIPCGLYKVTALLQEIIPVSTKPLSDSILLQIIFTGLYTELLKTAEHFENDASNQEPTSASKASICYTLSEALCSVDEDDKHTEQINLFLKQAKDSMNYKFNVRSDAGLSGVSTIKIDDLENGIPGSPTSSYATELDIETADYIAEVLASDILTSSVGKQSLRVCYNYLKNNKEWLFQELGVSEFESNQFDSLHGQNIAEVKQSVLKSMFYIGNTPFDQLLTGGLKIDFSYWLQTPLSLNLERAWLQISRRCEFQENAKLSLAETAMVAAITKHLKTKLDTYEANNAIK